MENTLEIGGRGWTLLSRSSCWQEEFAYPWDRCGWVNTELLHVANLSAVFWGGGWSEMACHSSVVFTGCCGGEICSVLKPPQPDSKLIYVYNPAKSPLCKNCLPPGAEVPFLQKGRSLHVVSGSWPSKPICGTFLCQMLWCLQALALPSPLVRWPLPARTPATVVGSCISSTPLPSLHPGWRAQLCFALLLPAPCFGFFFFLFCDKQVPTALSLPMAAFLFFLCPQQLTVQ